MFLMIGVTDGRKDIEYDRVMTCEACGRYGRFKVFMTYTALLLFFIPVFKWNRKYFVQSSCCGALYELDSEIGIRIASGENIEIRPQDLHRVGASNALKRCGNCGFTTDQDFEFCPKCGKKF